MAPKQRYESYVLAPPSCGVVQVFLGETLKNRHLAGPHTPKPLRRHDHIRPGQSFPGLSWHLPLRRSDDRQYHLQWPNSRPHGFTTMGTIGTFSINGTGDTTNMNVGQPVPGPCPSSLPAAPLGSAADCAAGLRSAQRLERADRPEPSPGASFSPPGPHAANVGRAGQERDLNCRANQAKRPLDT